MIVKILGAVIVAAALIMAVYRIAGWMLDMLGRGLDNESGDGS